MATLLKTATFSGSNGSHFYIELHYELLEQVAATKTSKVKYYLYVGSYDVYKGSGTASTGYINGVAVGSVTSIESYSKKLVGTRTETLTHDKEGKCSPSYSANFTTPWTGVNSSSLSGSYDLPTIDIVSKLHIKIDGVWKEATPYIKADGAWKEVTPYLKVNGVWKESA